jgi:zinc finger CCHC domain-containing protein 9
MTCFACREVGHSAKDCPSIRPDADRDGPTTTTTKTNAKTAAVVGICYRCGSRKHNLARCRLPARPDNPLPYASCFVCSGQGHLAGSCPRNNGRGVYPNGGSCKLCGETTHLARDCTLRKIGQQLVFLFRPPPSLSPKVLTNCCSSVLLSFTDECVDCRGERCCDVAWYRS